MRFVAQPQTTNSTQQYVTTVSLSLSPSLLLATVWCHWYTRSVFLCSLDLLDVVYYSSTDYKAVRGHSGGRVLTRADLSEDGSEERA